MLDSDHTADPQDMLSARERERLCHIVETATTVRRRSQFYLWAQGALQGLVPHEILVCAHGDLARRSLAFFRSASVPLSDAEATDLEGVDTGLAVQVIRAWAELGGAPLILSPEAPAHQTTYRHFEAALVRLRLDSIAVHGTPAMPGYGGSYFVFARLGRGLTPRLGYLLDLVLPQLHLAHLRIAAASAAERRHVARTERVLTGRELQILRWVREGKSNIDIAAILSISPLTVKNHVQKILRKLNVQNRAQAVARAISLRLMGSESRDTG